MLLFFVVVICSRTVLLQSKRGSAQRAKQKKARSIFFCVQAEEQSLIAMPYFQTCLHILQVSGEAKRCPTQSLVEMPYFQHQSKIPLRMAVVFYFAIILNMKNATNLKDEPTLKDLQQYIKLVNDKRGFSDETVSELFMLLLEESGEFARAARKTAGIKSDVNKVVTTNLSHEAADVLIYLLSLCNKLDIDLEQAFRDKEEVNNSRTWL